MAAPRARLRKMFTRPSEVKDQPWLLAISNSARAARPTKLVPKNADMLSSQAIQPARRPAPGLGHSVICRPVLPGAMRRSEKTFMRVSLGDVEGLTDERHAGIDEVDVLLGRDGRVVGRSTDHLVPFVLGTEIFEGEEVDSPTKFLTTPMVALSVALHPAPAATTTARCSAALRRPTPCPTTPRSSC